MTKLTVVYIFQGHRHKRSEFIYDQYDFDDSQNYSYENPDYYGPAVGGLYDYQSGPFPGGGPNGLNGFGSFHPQTWDPSRHNGPHGEHQPHPDFYKHAHNNAYRMSEGSSDTSTSQKKTRTRIVICIVVLVFLLIGAIVGSIVAAMLTNQGINENNRGPDDCEYKPNIKTKHDIFEMYLNHYFVFSSIVQQVQIDNPPPPQKKIRKRTTI